MRQDQKRIFKLMPRAEALERTLASVDVRMLTDESVPVDESCGRILAEDVVAPRDQPPHDRGAMDGYAVRSQDTAGASASNPIKLRIVGKLFPPDRPETAKIGKGECAYTSTGAPLPEGSDALIPVENTRLIEEAIEVVRHVSLGENVSARGGDVKQGQLLFKRGHVVSPQGIGVLLSFGIRKIGVVRKPRAGIISVGDELADAYEQIGDKVANDHAYVICELLRQLGAEPRIFGVVPDDPEMIRTKITEAIRDSDILVTIAGSSVGIRDLVPDVVSSVGKTVFHGIAITPGKVTGAGIINGKPIIMLPGYFMSALAGFYLYVVPLVNLMLGREANWGLPVVEAKLERTARGKHGLERFQLLEVSRLGNSYLATPIEAQFGSLMHISRANAYAIIPKGKTLRKGRHVTATLLAASEFRRMQIQK